MAPALRGRGRPKVVHRNASSDGNIERAEATHSRDRRLVMGQRERLRGEAEALIAKQQCDALVLELRCERSDRPWRVGCERDDAIAALPDSFEVVTPAATPPWPSSRLSKRRPAVSLREGQP